MVQYEQVLSRLGPRHPENGTNAPRPENASSFTMQATTTEEMSKMDTMAILDGAVEAAGRQMVSIFLIGAVLAVLLLTAAWAVAGIMKRAR